MSNIEIFREMLRGKLWSNSIYYLVCLPMLVSAAPVMILHWSWWSVAIIVILLGQPLAIWQDWRNAKGRLAQREVLR